MAARLPSAALVLSVFAVGFAGCDLSAPEEPIDTGSASATPAAAATAEPQFLSDREIDAQPESSPERAALEFWRSVQNRDLLTAYRGLSTRFREQFGRSLSHFQEFVMADYQRWLTNPEVVSTDVRGTEASVLMRYPHPEAPPDRMTFTMRRESGQWKLAYDFYLANRLNGK